MLLLFSHLSHYCKYIRVPVSIQACCKRRLRWTGSEDRCWAYRRPHKKPQHHANLHHNDTSRSDKQNTLVSWCNQATTRRRLSSRKQSQNLSVFRYYRNVHFGFKDNVLSCPFTKLPESYSRSVFSGSYN